MKRIVQFLIAASALAAIDGAVAATPGKCDVTGNWTDKFGAEATFQTNKKGIATDPSLCAKPYRLTVTKLNARKFDVSAVSARMSCPTFTASLRFDGGCGSATGTVAVTGKGSYHDTWTMTGAAVRHAPVPSAALNQGLQ
jgi:hypothetical protein